MNWLAMPCVLWVTHTLGVLANPTLEVLASSVMLSDGETAVEYLKPKPMFSFCYNELHTLS